MYNRQERSNLPVLLPLNYSLVGALTMTVGANDIALFDLALERAERYVTDTVHLENLFLAHTVVEVHHVVRVLHAAVGARARLRLAHELATPHVRAHAALDIL